MAKTVLGARRGSLREAGGAALNAPTRKEAFRRVEEWWECIQREAIVPGHPLVGVQSLHLVAAGDSGPYRHYGKETRPAGRSRPLVRDLPRSVRRTDRIMRDIRSLDQRYYHALMYLAEHRGLVSRVAEVMMVSRATARRFVDAGIGMMQMALLRG